MGGAKVERVRHLFQECLKDCSIEHKKLLLLVWADYEENFGLLSHAMEVYEQAASDNSISSWNVYISKAITYYGVVRARTIY